MTTAPQTETPPEELSYDSPEVQDEVQRRLGLRGGEAAGCLARGAKYGTQASLLTASFGGVDPYTQGAAWAIGGIYGCTRGNGAKKVWREWVSNYRSAERKISRAGSWLGRLVSGKMFSGKGKGQRRTPPTGAEAMAITVKYFTQGHQEQVFVSGDKWITTSTLVDLYGPSAAAWDARKLSRQWWSIWQRSLALEPGWRPEFRLFHAVLRVGLFLERAPASASIEDWPVIAPAEAAVPESQHIADANERLQSGQATAGPETSEPIMTSEDVSTESLLWGLVGLLGGAR